MEEPGQRKPGEEVTFLSSIREFFEILYEEAVAYQTVKLVKTKDMRLGAMQKCFTACVFIYVLFGITVDNGYLEKEIPDAKVIFGTTYDQDVYKKLVKDGATPDFCHQDVPCTNRDPYQALFDDLNDNFATKVVSHTYFRYCSGDNEVFCQTISYENSTYYPVWTEKINMTIQFSYSTSWGDYVDEMDVTLVSKESGERKHIGLVDVVYMDIETLLEFMGANLDQSIRELRGDGFPNIPLRDWGATITCDAQMSNFMAWKIWDLRPTIVLEFALLISPFTDMVVANEMIYRDPIVVNGSKIPWEDSWPQTEYFDIHECDDISPPLPPPPPSPHALAPEFPPPAAVPLCWSPPACRHRASTPPGPPGPPAHFQMGLRLS
ncbi:hypothetical protein CYMTET_13505 [Cymbomonas tetramitiformis]|uniref:Uncharacterized protein n=1 Tax=Cymbomonas tetramitiformis TaxID=36881 RepID=A0AAE0GID3_9CHLO|nr:hypothetical protein CYMTET_13505 [Cymbomonas tetramitiformis]